jgi:putative component of toxin-antitoxin plasmid stabilization module
MQVEHYVDENGDDLFGQSLQSLPARARRRALTAIDRMETGNFGDWKAIGGRLREHRIHSEGGIRI